MRIHIHKHININHSAHLTEAITYDTVNSTKTYDTHIVKDEIFLKYV